jgi:repressor LexA
MITMPRPLSARLTARQQTILDAINRFRDARGMSPTVRELCDLLGLRSTSTVQSHLQALRRKGALLDTAPGTPRALVTRTDVRTLQGRGDVLRLCREAIDAFRDCRRQGYDVLSAQRLAMEKVERMIAGADPTPAPNKEEALT